MFLNSGNLLKRINTKEMAIAENLLRIKESLPKNVTLVAVSKTKPVTDLMEAYTAGQRIFGENKIQEMVDKWEQMPKDIEWHMIGHVQTNKVKFIPGKKVITGLTNMVIADVPTPIGLPFAYFPMSKETSISGIILPNYNDSNARGFSLQNFGYYTIFLSYILQLP